MNFGMIIAIYISVNKDNQGGSYYEKNIISMFSWDVNKFIGI